MKQKNFLKIAMLFVFAIITTNALGQTTVSYAFSDGGAVTGLNEGSPGITLDTNIGFGSFKNSGTANPALSGGQLRLYQNVTKGGSIIIYALNGVTITGVTITASSRTGPAGYTVDGGAQTNLPGSSPYTISSISATSQVEFFQRDGNSSNRIYVDSFQVTYTGGAPAAPGITLGAVSGNTNETGTNATFTAVLDKEPATDVVLNITSGDTGEVTVSPATLTFTNANWNTPQTITATGVDDALVDGNQNVTITVAVDDATSDDAYDGLSKTTTVINEDDEVPPLPTPGAVFITEVSDAAASGNEYIEIYNNTNESVSLNTSKLVMLSSGGTVQTIWDINIDIGVGVASIPARGFLIITRGGTQAAFEGIHGALSANTIFIQGTSAMYFGTGTARRWRLYTGGTESNADGTLIDDTDSGVGGANRHYQNIFTDTYVSDSEASATPGALEYLVYSSGAWVNGVAMDGTTAAKDVYLYDNLSVSEDVQANNFGITDNKFFSFSNNTKSLTINGNLTINNGAILGLTSYNRPTGNYSNSLLLTGSYTPIGNGKITYSRDTHISGSPDWAIVASPLTGESIETFVGNNSIDTNANNFGIAPYNNNGTAWNYYTGVAVADGGTGAGTGAFPLNAAGNFVGGKGYSVKALNAYGTLSFEGGINTAVEVDVTITTDSGNPWNAVGNPYPSFMNADNFVTKNTAILDDAFQTAYVWNGSSYFVFDGIGTYLHPGQGFFVKAKGASATLKFEKSNQSAQGTGITYYRSELKPEIKIIINSEDKMSYAKVNYLETSTTGLDPRFDFGKFGGTSRNFDVYTKLLSNDKGIDFEVQSLPLDYENLIVPLGINATAGKEITFSAEALNLPSDIKVFLEDRLTNTFTRLDEANSNYKVTLTENANGIGRFYLHTASKVLSTKNESFKNISIYKTNASILKIVGLQQENTNVKLFTILGKEVLNTTFKSNGVKEISLPKLAKGVYLVQLETESGKMNKKIIIE